jgi:peptide/nickel transport system permease protein
MAGLTRASSSDRLRPSGTAAAGLAGATFLALLTAIALLAPWIAPGDPLAMSGAPRLGPFADPSFPLGTDRLGRDVLAGLVHGSRLSVGIGVATAAIAILAGATVGTLAGFLGGIVDAVLMRIADAVQTVPMFLLALALIGAFGPSATTVVIAISIAAWPAPARLVRGEVLSLRERDFVSGCRVIGMPPLRIAFGEVLPNALAPLAALAGTLVASAILVESALAFLGLGDPNYVSWGAMVAEGRAVMRTDPFLVAIPGAAIAATVLAVTLVSDWVADVLALSELPA